ncbi:hypothetical protein EC973_004983 [Apophysomyces ossiformis]|uniref:Mtf2-like C-terminal domain-containing protein n=1 Tax=Apophysomyces ossiformis TaxID=679940 RepID=A0A8H7BPJ8_9FUNG|nr:hypothetical protein EC973_004983 [Apophysomyces ossiformis]
MIPRSYTFQHLRKLTPKNLPRPAYHVCQLRYSTASHGKVTSDEFWSIPEPQQKQTRIPSEETRDFKQLLDSLFDRSVSSAAPEPRIAPQASSPTKRRTESLIEKRLLEMVARNKKPYKRSSPLPKNFLGSPGGVAQSGSLLTSVSQWDARKVVDSNLSLRDQEMNAVNAILDSKNSHDLLKRVLEEINMTGTYPPYYSRILAKSIEHAAMGFGDPYLGLAIFEQAKERSIESYVTGCTVEVYNAVLLLRWRLWRDVYGMLQLIEEMSSHGISYDENTRRIVQMVASEIEGNLLELEPEKESTWSVDAKRSANVMKLLVSKWMMK